MGLGLGLEDRSPLATAPLESNRVSAAIIKTSFLSSLRFTSLQTSEQREFGFR